MSEAGRVSQLTRYPFKSMLGEPLDVAKIDVRGLSGDRAYALIDEESGKIVSVKRPRRWARMFKLTAFTGDDGNVRVRLSSGESLRADDPALADRLSEFFERRVRVASVPPKGASFDEVWERELKGGIDPYFDLPTRIEDGEEMIDGGGFMHKLGHFANFGAIHLVTTGSTRRLSELAPESRFEPSRFRANIVIETPEAGFVENGWVGRTLQIGEVELAVTLPVPRCVMTTLKQGDAPADRGVLKAITQHNRIDIGGLGASYPCVGVYANIAREGMVKVGDPVRLS